MYPYSAEQETEFVNKRRRITLTEKIKTAQNIILSNFPGVCFEKQYNNKNTVVFVPKKDELTRICPIAMRQHNSNTIFFEFNLFSDDVLCKCFKPACTGSVLLTSDGSLSKELSDKVVSTSTKKNRKSKEFVPLPDVKNIKISNFCHQTIHISSSDIFDLYKALGFAFCPAKKNEKRPVFSGWTKHTAADNFPIDMANNNVAIVTGKNSGIFVLDIDTKDSGLDYFQRFCVLNSFNYTTYTMCVLTPSGGIHLYFKYSETLSENRVRMKDVDGLDVGLDIRSNEGCVIAPPSVYPTGVYSFLCLKPPQVCPDFILSLFSVT